MGTVFSNSRSYVEPSLVALTVSSSTDGVSNYMHWQLLDAAIRQRFVRRALWLAFVLLSWEPIHLRAAFQATNNWASLHATGTCLCQKDICHWDNYFEVASLANWSFLYQWHTEVGGGEFGGSTPPPEIPKAPQNRAKLNPIVKTVKKIAEFRKPTHQDVRKKGIKILKLPPVCNCFTLAMTNKLVSS